MKTVIELEEGLFVQLILIDTCQKNNPRFTWRTGVQTGADPKRCVIKSPTVVFQLERKEPVVAK
jgi:hypothetical protein